MQRTNFSPIQHGFKFANTFINELADLPGFGKIETAGRCGGMSYTALDYFLNELPVPSTNTLPADGVPLADYILQRQTETFLSPSAVNFISWTLNADEPTWFAKGVHKWTVENEFPRLRTQIDLGQPQVLGLIAARDMAHIGYNHQVVACGYDVDASGNITVLIYDCNSPGCEVTLTAGPNLVGVASSNGYTWRGFFVHGYEKSSPSFLADGTLVRETSSPAIFTLLGGGKLSVSSMDEFKKMGYQENQVRIVPDGSLKYIADAPGNGILLKERWKDPIFVIYGGMKFPIPDQTVFKALGFLSGKVQVVPQGSLAALPQLPMEGTLLREMSKAEVYVMKGQSRHWVPSPQAFLALGFVWQNVCVVPDGDLGPIPDGGPVA